MARVFAIMVQVLSGITSVAVQDLKEQKISHGTVVF
jgi:hypothetical protein